MPFLDVQSVYVNYGEVEALRGATLVVEEGESVALVGANGAGKTTLINTISGLNAVRQGGITFDGTSLAKVAPHKLPGMGIVQVPEGRRLFPHLSVEDNLRLGAFHLRARRETDSSLQRVFDTLPVLRTRIRQEAGTLSGGQQQMLAIGRALMAQPRLLLLDEPSLGLAPIIVDELFEIIKNIADQGTAILLVEQNVTKALRLVDRAYAMQQGMVIMDGSGEEMLADPSLADAMLGIATVS